MNNENTRIVEFTNPDIIFKLNLLSNEYTVPFDVLVNLAVLKLIDDVSLLRMLRNGNLNLTCLSERVLS